MCQKSKLNLLLLDFWSIFTGCFYVQSGWNSKKKLAILGGGQLGRMMLPACHDLGIEVMVLDPDPESPCSGLVPKFVTGDYRDARTVFEFAKEADVVTIEIEHVSVEGLAMLEESKVIPSISSFALGIIQDKLKQKEFYKNNDIPSAPFIKADNPEMYFREHGFRPCVQKQRKHGYDGQGVRILKSPADIPISAPSILEEIVDYKKEISVVLSRNRKGEVSFYPVCEMQFHPQRNLVEYLFAPAEISEDIQKEAIRIAGEIADKLLITGILAVEMFLTKDNKILVNEIAPRPHNSGHNTIEACPVSQFASHVRSIFGLHPGNTETKMHSAMINLLGEEGARGTAYYQGLEEVLSSKNVFVHIYGKKETRPGRKMGHVTVLSENKEELKILAKKIKETLKVLS